MPVTPDEFRTHANAFDAAFADSMREQFGDGVPAYGAAHFSFDDVQDTPGLPISDYAWKGICTPETKRRQRIVEVFHQAIATKNTEVVHTMVNRGFVSPDVPAEDGSTPLAAAVDARNLLMAKLLLDLGADVNLVAARRDQHLPRWRRKRHGVTPPERQRTPLMLAAAEGQLAMLRLLLDAGADDALVAPDGQTALRLAADAGHRDLVDALPARRGGAWRRWRHHNERSVYRARSAVMALYYFARFFVWDVPKYFLWTVPKRVGERMGRGAKWLWAETKVLVDELAGALRREIKLLPGRLRAAAAWMLEQIRAMPARINRGSKAFARFARAAGSAAWEVIKATPAWVAEQGRRAAVAAGYVARWTADAATWTGRKLAATPGALWRATKTTARWTRDFLKATAKLLWRMIKALPAALAVVWAWIKTSSVAIGNALVALLAKPIALLHTAAMAVISLLQRARNVTLRDLWNAFIAMMAAIANVPRQIWHALTALQEVSFKVFAKLFGLLGVVVWAIGWVVVQIVLYIPRQLGVILVAAGSSVKKGGHEVAVWINPKY
ncbi:hypothetical protein CC85DRAFT_326021 [Cutaneotrichosporon oleaginosum]|uniref:Uncharacterized protein n=1 Tax=Cutaneotrichosporon oleaginosum TaxID=879819 RepID=A0A0J0XVM1_9TREE|nr:uncharacterized protein CC85DRAFT_326021 [Cutaneotrichosporon oleaginosum]KLT45111.1 hypothetical protein CC85DRAFT_326021 [Cutaneotrichosporon oleaginosum]TXT09792.1 hypothetical protein COLE_03726 [Cutaneotrichosporon oleaginosum]